MRLLSSCFALAITCFILLEAVVSTLNFSKNLQTFNISWNLNDDGPKGQTPNGLTPKKNQKRSVAPAVVQLAAGGLFQRAVDMMFSSDVIRACAIEVRNAHPLLGLRSPHHYSIVGRVAVHPPLVVAPKSVELFMFQKSPFSFHGTAGVVTFDLYKVDNHTKRSIPYNTKLMLMWLVPLSYVRKVNKHAIGIRKHTLANKALYLEMRSGKQRDFVRDTAKRSLIYKFYLDGVPVIIYSRMSDKGRSHLILDILTGT